MEVSIRLQKSEIKAKGRYNYRIVAIPKNTPRQGRALEILGHYDSAKQPATYAINLEKLDQWVAKGAQMSETVKALVKSARKKA